MPLSLASIWTPAPRSVLPSPGAGPASNPHQHARIAQLAERCPRKTQVVGSEPTASPIIAGTLPRQLTPVGEAQPLMRSSYLAAYPRRELVLRSPSLLSYWTSDALTPNMALRRTPFDTPTCLSLVSTPGHRNGSALKHRGVDISFAHICQHSVNDYLILGRQFVRSARGKTIKGNKNNISQLTKRFLCGTIQTVRGTK